MSKTLRNLALGALATTAMTGLAMMPVIANAGADKDQVVTASKAGQANPDLALSQDGYNVMRGVRAARIAIFNGDTVAASNFVDMALKDLDKSKADESLVKTKDGSEASWIPIDGQLVVADNFVATPEKTQHIATGNQKLKEGKTDEAMKELKLADVDVGFTRVLMPLGETMTHVKTAAKLIKGEDYYEANLALKAAEDGLNFDTVMLVGTPKDAAAKDAAAKPAAAKDAQAKPTATN